LRHSAKKRGSTRFHTTKAAEVAPKLTVTGQPKAALHADPRIRERTLCLAAKVVDNALGFCGRGAKENILVHMLWLELIVLIGADATPLPQHEDQGTLTK
jgi:hypothetical protein